MVVRMTHRTATHLALLPVLAGLAACVPAGPPPMEAGPVKGEEYAAAPMPLPPVPGYGPAPAAPGYTAVQRGYEPPASYGVPPPPPGSRGPGSYGVPPPPQAAYAGQGSYGVLPPPGYGGQGSYGVPPPPAEAYAAQPARPGGARAVGTGSAFAITQRGLAVTNAHVVEGCRAVTDEQGRPVQVVAADRRRDLALIETGRPFPSVVRFRGRGGAALGETALVFGFPYGQALGTGINLTNGIVTGTTGIGGDPSRFQMNAAVQPGNSGGPVVDDNGLLLGVAVGRLNDLSVLRATGSLPQSINFAIRAETVEQFLAANGVQPPRSDATGAAGPQAVSARIAPAVFQVVCRG